MFRLHGNTRKGCPVRRCDRPRRIRLISAAARGRRPRGRHHCQLVTERRAIGPSKQAVNRQEDEYAKYGRKRVDRFHIPSAPNSPRVAEEERGGRKSKRSHYL